MDTKYWKLFYENNKNFKNKNSAFSEFILDFFKDKNIKSILDVGCGNGLDSYFFSKKYNVVGIDSAGYKLKETKNFKFFIDDFCSFKKDNYDLIYSRFSFHSINDKQQIIFLESIKINSYLCIETRSDKGKDLYKFYGDNHYRNYTNIDYLKNLLLKYNFEILYLEENIDFAIYKQENPICIRLICKKI